MISNLVFYERDEVFTIVDIRACVIIRWSGGMSFGEFVDKAGQAET